MTTSHLYSHQLEAVEAACSAIRGRRLRQPVLVHIPTGGGKTRVAIEIARRCVATLGGPCLIVSKSWEIVAQVAGELARFAPELVVQRWGATRDRAANLPAWQPRHRNRAPQVILTTLHTFDKRSEAAPDAKVVIWDECHWAEHAALGRGLLDWSNDAGIPLVGLTATPRPDSRFNRIFSISFTELVRVGRLARPNLQVVDTGTAWRPRVEMGRETAASLTELADNPCRNRLIVEWYLAHAGRYGRTIIFACNQKHAAELAAALARAGIAARAIVSDNSDEVNERSLRQFRDGSVDVIVNVDKLTHGVDVPDVRTVFLARPTTSEILYAQMVGRGARIAPDKSSFELVEFGDRLTAHHELFDAVKREFWGASSAPMTRVAAAGPRPTRRSAHAYDPTGAPTWISGTTGDDPIAGLWYQQNQTFGIELELTGVDGVPARPDQNWQRIAEGLRRALATRLGADRVAPNVLTEHHGSAGEKDLRVWNVEWDGSAGWEVTSPVLANEEGYREVVAACAALDAVAGGLGLKVSHRTGLHVHLGWGGRSVEQVKRAISLWRLFEPALATLVAPSRIARFSNGRYDVAEANEYTLPISTAISSEELARAASVNDLLRAAERSGATRYVTLNLLPLATINTVEIRLHNGTLEAEKILRWVSLAQQILWAACVERPIPLVADTSVLAPTGDIVSLAREYLPDARQPAQRRFIDGLVRRRAEILAIWRSHPELAPWCRDGACERLAA